MLTLARDVMSYTPILKNTFHEWSWQNYFMLGPIGF